MYRRRPEYRTGPHPPFPHRHERTEHEHDQQRLGRSTGIDVEYNRIQRPYPMNQPRRRRRRRRGLPLSDREPK